MEPEIKDGSEVLETTENVETETTEETPEALSPEEIAELKAKAAKADELEAKNKQLFERAKKAESKPVDGLSQKDVIFLAKSDIHDDDIEEVTDYARLKKIPVADAYKFLKPVLDVRNEERKTAQVTSTKGGSRIQKATGDQLLQRAQEKGEVPESDEGINALVQARMASRMKK